MGKIDKIIWIISLNAGLSISLLLNMRSINIFLSLILGFLLGFAFKYIFLKEEFLNGTEKKQFTKKEIIEETNGIRENINEETINTEAIAYSNSITNQEKDKIKTINLSTSTTKVKVNAGNITDNTLENDIIDLENDIIGKISDKLEETFKKGISVIKNFFSENTLAKIGGILIFLGIFFFLNLFYVGLGTIGRIIIGFLVGFSMFGIGIFINKKGYKKEAMVLFGISILINYLVILAGRYFIGNGDTYGDENLSSGISLILLILNTIFAITTSLVYKSKTLLIFSFVFSYLNPFLVGSISNDPYIFISYGATISTGALILSTYLKKLKNINLSKYILYTAFIGGNLLFLTAPFTETIGWIAKLIFVSAISISSIFLAYKNGFKNELFQFFGSSYILLTILLITGINGLGIDFSSLSIYLSYFIYMLLLGAGGIILIENILYKSILLTIPILLLLGLIFTGNLTFIIPTLFIILFSYIYIFSSLFKNKLIGNQIKYGLFFLILIFCFGINSYFNFITSFNLNLAESISIFISSFIFLISAYYYSSKENLGWLYTIGTLGTISLITPIIKTSGEAITLSIISIIIFAIVNIGLPLKNKNIIKNNLANMIIGLISGILFIGFEVFNFGNVYFPGISLGIAFTLLAIIYFILGFITNKNIKLEKEKVINIIYSFLGISISLFSLAIIFIFSESPEIISAIWLFESSVLFFFYNKVKNQSIYIAATILFLIGIIKFITILGIAHSENFMLLIPIILIFLSSIINIKLLNFEKSGIRYAHDILHMILMIMILISLIFIIPNPDLGIFVISIFISLLLLIYSYFDTLLIKYFMIGIFIIFLLTQFALVSTGELNIKIFQYLSVISLGLGTYFSNKIRINRSTIVSFIIYLFLISTIFVNNIFENTFIITIYRGISVFALLLYGIEKDRIKFRTIGIYILTITLGKILFYDIWKGIDNLIFRVLALVLVGGLMIGISMMYSKKQKGNLLGEFSLKELLK